MLNQITVMGRLTRDVELRTTKTGKSVAGFTVACERDYQDKEVDFIDCFAWDRTAEFIHRNFRKGMMVIVEGRLQSRKWEDKNGGKRTAWEINTRTAYYGEKKRDGDANATPTMYDLDDDGEVPF